MPPSASALTVADLCGVRLLATRAVPTNVNLIHEQHRSLVAKKRFFPAVMHTSSHFALCDGEASPQKQKETHEIANLTIGRLGLGRRVKPTAPERMGRVVEGVFGSWVGESKSWLG